MTELTVLDLPTCHLRGRQLEPDRWECGSKWLIVGPRGVRSETCRTHCRWVDKPPPDGLADLLAAAAKHVAGPCVHLGPPTGQFRDCPTCSGNVRLKVMGCGVHTTCTVGRKVDGVACCVGCTEFKAIG